MANRQQENRMVRPIVSPRNRVRIGSLIKVGTENFLEVKHDKKKDYVTTTEMVELMEGRKVKKIIFQDNPENNLSSI